MKTKIYGLAAVAVSACFNITVSPRIQPQVESIVDNSQFPGTESREILGLSTNERVAAFLISFDAQPEALQELSVDVQNLDVSGGRKNNSPAKTVHLLDAAGLEIAPPVDVPEAEDGIGGTCFCGPVTFLLDQPLPSIDVAGKVFQIAIDVVEVKGTPTDPRGVVAGTQGKVVVVEGGVVLTGAEYLSNPAEGAVMTFVEFLSGGCGDGFLDAGEECDDANTVPGDGCNEFCLNELQIPATLLASLANDLLQVFVTGTAGQEIVDLSFVANNTAGVLPSVPAKTIELCWVEVATGLAPAAALSTNLGLKDAANGQIVAPAVAVDGVTGCAAVVLDNTFSLSIGDPAKTFTVIGDIAAADQQQKLVLKDGLVLGVASEVVGNNLVETVGRLAYSGFAICLVEDVANPTLVNQSGLPAADMTCEAFGEPVTMTVLQWNMAKIGQVGSINNFSVTRDGVGLAGQKVGCSAPAGVDQCLIFQPTADVLLPGAPATYQLLIDVAGAAGSGASQTWTGSEVGIIFTASDGSHNSVGLLSGSATLSN